MWNMDHYIKVMSVTANNLERLMGYVSEHLFIILYNTRSLDVMNVVLSLIQSDQSKLIILEN